MADASGHEHERRPDASLGAPRPDHKFTTVRLSPALPALTSIELETISELKFKTTAGSIFILHHIGLCIVSEHE